MKKEPGDGWMIRSPFIGDMPYTYNENRFECIWTFATNWSELAGLFYSLVWRRLKRKGFKCVKAHIGPKWKRWGRA